MKRMVGVSVAFALAFVCLAQEPAELAKEPGKFPSDVLPASVAECLPPVVGQWVKDMGADTALDELPSCWAEEFRSGAPSSRAMLGILEDKVDVVRTKLPNTVISGDHLVAVTNVIVAGEHEGEESRVIAIGEKILPGDEILAGLIFNLPPHAAPRCTSAVFEDGETTVALDVGEGLNIVPSCARSCSITCGTGERACCWDCTGGSKCCACCSCVPASSSCPEGLAGGTNCTISCADSN